MKNKVLLLCGLLATTVYALTVILGGWLRPDYSHVAQAVSDLIAAGAPNKPLLDPLFGLYNLLTLGFGIGLWQYVRRAVPERGKVVGTAGALVLVAEGLFGLATLFFPEDAGGLGTTISAAGTLHIVFASLSSLATMLAILLMGFWFRSGPRLGASSLYSFLSVAVVFVSGGLTAASLANHLPITGLLERITIGGFLLWMLVIAWTLYASESRPAQPATRSAVAIGARR